ncbi:hypothetical protein HPB47_022240 [Ixodes persulcatus]|uniref:Uncharacterized protein n=1 Tax=Ixodes persulcatus TaxID=34615 RepID=A0AC60QCR1_IXOPE|nr:hypothetical protein HPB47_022240 [Ixodes persulcatus]
MTHNYVVAQERSKQTQFMKVLIQRQFISELTMELLSTNEISDFDACEEGLTSELVLKNVFWCSTDIVLKNYCGKKLKFANVIYTCKHGGATRATGTGIRPHQRTMKRDCPAKVVVAARRSGVQQLEITELKTEHNHEVSYEIFRTYPECRQLSAEEVDFVKPLMELNVLPSLIVEKLKERSGKAVIAKDLYNLRRETYGQDEANMLLKEQHVVTRLLELFVQENTATANTRVVVVDKDFTEITAVRTTFPSAPAVQLCQFHVFKAFRAAVGHLAKSSDERERLSSCFGEMLHAPTPDKFKEAKAEFERFASADVSSYFAKNWGSIPEMWARHLCDREFTGGNNTTNRVESHNARIKHVLASSSKLHEALRGLMKLSSSMLHEVRHKTMLLKTSEFYSYEASEDVQKQCSKVLTPYACKLVSDELAKTRDDPPQIEMLSPETYSVSSSCSDFCHKVSFQDQSCSCTTYAKMGLLCRHFLAVCVKFSLKPSLEKAVHKRWFKSCQLEFLSNSAKSNPEAGSSEEPRILSMPGPSFERMNRNQRFNYAMRTLRAVADNLADCQPDVFATRLALLESLNASWLRREDVTPRVYHEDVEVAENVTTQDVRPAIVSTINQQEETDQEQVNVATGCASSRSNVTVPDSDTPSSASQGCTVTLGSLGLEWGSVAAGYRPGADDPRDATGPC